jgi:hypothetical protein
MYSRSNVNPVLSTVNNQNAFTTGASLIHTQSFDQLKDLWTSNRRRKRKEEEKKKQQAEDSKPDSSSPPITNEDARKEENELE